MEGIPIPAQVREAVEEGNLVNPLTNQSSNNLLGSARGVAGSGGVPSSSPQPLSSVVYDPNSPYAQRKARINGAEVVAAISAMCKQHLATEGIIRELREQIERLHIQNQQLANDLAAARANGGGGGVVNDSEAVAALRKQTAEQADRIVALQASFVSRYLLSRFKVLFACPALVDEAGGHGQGAGSGHGRGCACGARRGRSRPGGRRIR
jgi:hypothetical protein